MESLSKNSEFQIHKLNLALFLRTMLLLSPVMLLFYYENGLTVTELFLFQGIFYLTSTILEIPVGYFSDSISKKWILFISLFTFFIINILWLFFKGYYVILAGEILFALSKVTLDNAMSGYLYDFLSVNETKHKDKKMVFKYGHLNFFLSIGTAIAGLFGTFLYVNWGSRCVILTELFMLFLGMLLIISLPKIKILPAQKTLKSKIEDYFATTKQILKNKSIMYYIYYSGIFTTFSIVFALSFQPLMKNAFVPVILFGIVAFFNHFTRALSAFWAGNFSVLLSLRKMIIPLYILYFISFIFIFLTLKIHNVYFVIFSIFTICLIIGFQLLFTIRHISRLHKFVNSEYRGNIISVNNFFSRLLTFIILVSSKLFMDKIGFETFYIFMFFIFLCCSVLMIKTYNIKEEN